MDCLEIIRCIARKIARILPLKTGKSFGKRIQLSTGDGRLQ